MKTIHKYKLLCTDEQTIFLPIDAEILTVQIQNNEPHLWVLLDTENETEKCIIEIFGTGNQINSIGPRSYIGTFQLNDGKLVFHVFEYLGL